MPTSTQGPRLRSSAALLLVLGLSAGVFVGVPGDLAEAYSDRDKARAQLILAKKAMDRLMMLERTQAIPIKDRESAQNDYAQAQSESERSLNRLRAIGVPAEEGGPTRVLSVKS